jgi:LysM repeat protein
MLAVPGISRNSLYPRIVLLALIALLYALGTSAPPQPAPDGPTLPATQPGASPEEGEFLFTTAADGNQLIYFIAGGARHSVEKLDVQLAVQRNPLWPLVLATPEDVLAFPEAAPIGNARVGLLAGDELAAVDPETAADGAPETAEPDASQYVLRRGDDLTRVSARYGSSVAAILAANGLSDPNRVYAGQTLVIPNTATAAAPVDPTAADQTMATEATATADADASTTYTVKRGDSAIRIARRFGVDENDLLAANGINDADRILIGQRLTIPD